MDRLNLLSFSPFRLNRLATEFSQALAADYARFGIDIPEWRVLATLGQHDEPRSAAYVVRCTRTHKSRISRAVSHLIELGLVARQEDGDDRREIMLQLTPEGRSIYAELVPILLAREAQLLSGFSEGQKREFERLLDVLEGSLGLVRDREG